MTLDAIDHFAIRVADIQKAVEWYQTSATCRVIYQKQTSALLEFANIKLALVLPSQEQPHLAFTREDADKFGELTPQVDGSMSCFIADSTGNMIELIKR